MVHQQWGGDLHGFVWYPSPGGPGTWSCPAPAKGSVSQEDRQRGDALLFGAIFADEYDADASVPHVAWKQAHAQVAGRALPGGPVLLLARLVSLAADDSARARVGADGSSVEVEPAAGRLGATRVSQRADAASRSPDSGFVARALFLRHRLPNRWRQGYATAHQ